MPIEQVKLLNLDWGDLGHLVVHVFLQLVIFMKKQKSSSGLLFTAKILQEAMYLASPYLGLIYPKMQDFKRVLHLNCK